MDLGSTQPLTEMSTRNLPGGQRVTIRRVRLTTLPPSLSRLSRENVGVSTSHNPMGLRGLLQGQLYLFYLYYPAEKPDPRGDSWHFEYKISCPSSAPCRLSMTDYYLSTASTSCLQGALSSRLQNVSAYFGGDYSMTCVLFNGFRIPTDPIS
jgi:hypothetical protein